MSHYMTALAMKQKNLKPSTKIVLYWLADHHNGETGLCFPSHRRLADCCEMTRQSIINQLKILEDKGLIVIEPRYRENGSFTSNMYRLVLIDAQEDPCDTITSHNVSSGVKNFDIPSKKTQQGTVHNFDNQNLVINNLVNEQNNFWSKIFEEMWLLYPKRVGKGAAKNAWLKACKKINVGELQSCLREYINTKQNADKKYIPHLTTWLNQERWNDELEPDQNIDNNFRTMVNDIARVRND